MTVHPCKTSAQDVEAEGSGVHRHLWLCSEFEATLDTRPQEQTNKQTNTSLKEWSVEISTL